MRNWKPLLVTSLVLLGAACGKGQARKSGGFFDITYRVGLAPTVVHVADMDCDGSLDVVTLCPGDSSISVMRKLSVPNIGSSGQDGVEIKLLTSSVEAQNLGSSGNDGVEIRILVRDSTRDLCVVDLNQDGFPDICAITGDPDFDLLRIMNDPKDPGSFTLDPAMDSVGGSPSRVAAGDVNGDGLQDVVVLDEATGEASLFLNSKAAPGTFMVPAVPLPSFGPDCRDLLLGDLDRDGLLEPMSLTSDGAFTFSKQAPKGTFTQKKWLPANFRFNVCMATGDVTGDGLVDVVIAARAGSGSEVFVLGNDPPSAAGFRESPSKQSLGQTRAMVLHDMNRDGALDLVTRDVNADGLASVGLLLGVRESPTKFSDKRLVANIGSSGEDGVAIDLPGDRRGLAVGDVNRDGFFDVFTELSIDGSVHVLARIPPLRESPTLIRESPTWVRTVQLDAPPSAAWEDMATGDLDGDGRLDLVTGGTDGLTVHFQDGPAPASFHSSSMGFGVVIDRVAVGDVDGDGRPDIAFSSSAGGLVGVVFHSDKDPEGFDPPAGSLFPTPSPRDIALGDLDGDGRCDLATTFEDPAAGGAVRITFQYALISRAFTGFFDVFTDDPSPWSLSIGDDDCDGQLDIACASGDGTLSFLRHAPGFPPPGAPLYLAPDVLPLAGGVHVAAGDLDGDGRVDLVTADPTGVSLTLQRPDGPRGVFQPSFKVALENSGIGDPDFDLLDINLDGLPDIVLATDLDGDGFTLLLQEPRVIDGFLKLRESPSGPGKGKRVAAGDVNGDGWPDVVTLSTSPGGTSHVFVWNSGGGAH